MHSIGYTPCLADPDLWLKARAISAPTSTVTNLASAMKDQNSEVKALANTAKRLVTFQEEEDDEIPEEALSNCSNTALVRGNIKKKHKK